MFSGGIERVEFQSAKAIIPDNFEKNNGISWAD